MVSPLAVAVPLSAAFLVVRAERSTVIDTVYVTITRTIHNYTGSPYTEYVTVCDAEPILPEATTTDDCIEPTEPVYSDWPTSTVTVPFEKTQYADSNTTLQINVTSLKSSAYTPSETPVGYTGSAAVLNTGPMAALIGLLGVVMFML